MRIALAALALAACSAPLPSHTFDNASGGTGDGSGDGSSAGNFGKTGSGGDGGAASTAGSDCSDAAKDVYVVSEENDLYRFQPGKLQFTKIGALNCGSGASPFSMAVDRTGTAWVDYDDGSLFKVSTADASCTPTSYQPQSGFATFGMGFASDTAGGTSESLYVCGFDLDGLGGGTALGLAKINTSTLALTPIAKFTGQLDNRCGELTGTGDAKLYGFFEGTPTMLAAIDKTSGAAPSPAALSGVHITTESAYAFSFWGGDFWFYTADGSNKSAVTRYKTATDSSFSVVVPNAGFTIVGAGVSTCAPTTPPPVN